MQQRQSWDTAVKHLARHGLLHELLSSEQIRNIASSNLNRWRNEPEDKYQYSEINKIIKEEIELIKAINQSSRLKKINKSYIKLSETFHHVITDVKGVQQTINKHKEQIVAIIEETKESIPIADALKIFNISRGTYENYKTIVIHACNASHFQWCTKRFPNQLVPQEVRNIKKYLIDDRYQHWSKASIYAKAVRDQTANCCLSTFYKYCRLLGHHNPLRKKKSDNYHPVKTTQPNELWCADVTIFKTPDGRKHYIHLLVDHYSKMILGYRIEKSNSSKAIRDLLREANLKHRPNQLSILTDAGAENVNTTVSSFLENLVTPTKHMIAQKDVVFSNSLIESINKVIKHQFLYPKQIDSTELLTQILEESVTIYNTVRPQWALQGNTPNETYNGVSMDFSIYKTQFVKQKTLRLAQNKQNNCSVCH